MGIGTLLRVLTEVAGCVFIKTEKSEIFFANKGCKAQTILL